MGKINLQLKTIILILGTFIGITLISGSIIYFSVSNHLEQDLYEHLENDALTIAKIQLAGRPVTGSKDSGDSLYKFQLSRYYSFRLEDKPGDLRRIADSIHLPVTFINNIRTAGKATLTTDSLLFTGILQNHQGHRYLIVAAKESSFESRLLTYLKNALFISTIIAAIIAFIISIYISKNIFKPIEKIRRRVREISSENLHLRINSERYNGELYTLAETFNDMLNRIETSFETQNNFISNASHELRTPLTGIIGTADVCLSKIRPIEEYVETLGVILREAEELDGKTKALLFLAQTGFNGKALTFIPVQIDQLLYEVKETLERLDRRNVVHFDDSLKPGDVSKLRVNGNEQLLHLAFTNIINNGCKYSDYQPVTVSIASSNHSIFIIVKDNGIGIPDKEVKFIYDPFFRASNTFRYEGYGIGMPLTRNIITMHRGKITVNSYQNIGTTVTVELPLLKNGSRQ